MTRLPSKNKVFGRYHHLIMVNSGVSKTIILNILAKEINDLWTRFSLEPISLGLINLKLKKIIVSYKKLIKNINRNKTKPNWAEILNIRDYKIKLKIIQGKKPRKSLQVANFQYERYKDDEGIENDLSDINYVNLPNKLVPTMLERHWTKKEHPFDVADTIEIAERSLATMGSYINSVKSNTMLKSKTMLKFNSIFDNN
ncbi:hypothetical protein A3Q56_05121 [Intoshia linei]|uniref:Uncharacterized protein n=1 Tax=Intoshia linei TaxID=1819745 RepID=A0A177AZ77_9BILA|nr:hypothetical protein A3Q56_05121 [Intoshia linei]